MPKVCPSFILASASPRRRTLLEQVGLVPSDIISADIDETPHPKELAKDYVKRLAIEKANYVSKNCPGKFVLAADTTVACGRRILGKPEHADEAKTFLSLLSGRRHRVYTGIALVHSGEQSYAKSVMTQVQFKRLHPDEVSWYLATEEWQGLAGGYAIQGKAARFVEAIHGSYTNVVGLPLCEAVNLLEHVGIKLESQ